MASAVAEDVTHNSMSKRVISRNLEAEKGRETKWLREIDVVLDLEDEEMDEGVEWSQKFQWNDGNEEKSKEVQVISSDDERDPESALGTSPFQFRANEERKKSTALKSKDRNGKLQSIFQDKDLGEVIICGSNQDEAAQSRKSPFN